MTIKISDIELKEFVDSFVTFVHLNDEDGSVDTSYLIAKLKRFINQHCLSESHTSTDLRTDSKAEKTAEHLRSSENCSDAQTHHNNDADAQG